MNLLTSLPPQVRAVVYWTYGVVGLAFGAMQVAQVDHLGSWSLVRMMAVFAYLGTALAITAGSNVRVNPPVDPAVVPDQRGAIDLATALIIGLILVVLLVLLGVFH